MTTRDLGPSPITTSTNSPNPACDMTSSTFGALFDYLHSFSYQTPDILTKIDPAETREFLHAWHANDLNSVLKLAGRAKDFGTMTLTTLMTEGIIVKFSPEVIMAFMAFKYPDIFTASPHPPVMPPSSATEINANPPFKCISCEQVFRKICQWKGHHNMWSSEQGLWITIKDEHKHSVTDRILTRLGLNIEAAQSVKLRLSQGGCAVFWIFLVERVREEKSLHPAMKDVLAFLWNRDSARILDSSRYGEASLTQEAWESAVSGVPIPSETSFANSRTLKDEKTILLHALHCYEVVQTKKGRAMEHASSSMEPNFNHHNALDASASNLASYNFSAPFPLEDPDAGMTDPFLNRGVTNIEPPYFGDSMPQPDTGFTESSESFF